MLDILHCSQIGQKVGTFLWCTKLVLADCCLLPARSYHSTNPLLIRLLCSKQLAFFLFLVVLVFWFSLRSTVLLCCMKFIPWINRRGLHTSLSFSSLDSKPVGYRPQSPQGRSCRAIVSTKSRPRSQCVYRLLTWGSTLWIVQNVCVSSGVSSMLFDVGRCSTAERTLAFKLKEEKNKVSIFVLSCYISAP